MIFVHDSSTARAIFDVSSSEKPKSRAAADTNSLTSRRLSVLLRIIFFKVFAMRRQLKSRSSGLYLFGLFELIHRFLLILVNFVQDGETQKVENIVDLRGHICQLDIYFVLAHEQRRYQVDKYV